MNKQTFIYYYSLVYINSHNTYLKFNGDFIMNPSTLLNRKTDKEIQAEIDKFNSADEDSAFSPETIAIVLDVSLSWLQKKRCEGGGIAFSKIHYRKIIYKKSDVLAYIRSQRIHSTSQVAV